MERMWGIIIRFYLVELEDAAEPDDDVVKFNGVTVVELQLSAVRFSQSFPKTE